VPNRWFYALLFSAVCVFIECVLNYGGQLVWEYSFWTRSFAGLWLIFIFGYFEFFVAAIFVLSRPTMKGRLAVIAVIYAVPVLMNIIGLGILGFTY